MADFQFLQNPLSKKWVILAPKRAKRPEATSKTSCPFCPERVGEEKEVYRVPFHDKGSWLVRVLNNKYPFAQIHEIIIHSPDHHRNFGELALNQVELILQTYRQRFSSHQSKGQVYIFHNRGEAGGESLPHPHTQLVVIPFGVKMDVPRLSSVIPNSFRDLNQRSDEMLKQVQHDIETDNFNLFCPLTSQWPDEVWVAPKERKRMFGEIKDEEIVELAKIISRLVQIFDLRHGHEFPYNFYIYQGEDWYLRLIPRLKKLGGFEIGTGIFVNTQDPQETIAFIKEHFDLSEAQPNIEKIRKDHQAEYERTV